MAEVNEQIVARIAALARIELQPAEIAEMTRDLSAIITYVDSLRELDLGAETPMAHPFMDQMRLRPDTVVPPLGAEAVLAIAPDPSDRSFRVPHIIGGDA